MKTFLKTLLKIIKNIFKGIFYIVVFIGLFALALKVQTGRFKSTPHHYTVTANTKVDLNSELAKYVTQKEINAVGYRYWDIDEEEVRDNPTMELLRRSLKSKDTDKILKFMQDNNISVDTPLHFGVTPLMYASFYDDEKTAKKLIEMGADPHKKDNYELSPMAYAMENNATKSVRLLLDSGVKFDEVEIVQETYGIRDVENWIDSISFDENATPIIHYRTKEVLFSGGGEPYYFISHLVRNNMYDIMKMVLESGYRPYTYSTFNMGEVYVSNKLEEIPSYRNIKNTHKRYGVEEFRLYKSVYGDLLDVPEPGAMIDLLLQYDIGGIPNDEFLKRMYDDKCYEEYRYDIAVGYYKMGSMFDSAFLQKHCSDKNATFKNIKEYILFVVGQKKIDKIEFAANRKHIKNPNFHISKEEVERLTNDYKEYKRNLFSKEAEDQKQ
ncbi:ankyrin repeat domain-containing protein [uncultured Campylobacter sp.]|uniref:ankyrin repeat domain-containing protein n=1 Tax=uncultured Campylobacter sp. TaxID=218934 RepID=UPI00263945BF|nr:ankyrin repeat domain-containing protein [uncultured Campylobacter sp.]